MSLNSAAHRRTFGARLRLNRFIKCLNTQMCITHFAVRCALWAWPFNLCKARKSSLRGQQIFVQLVMPGHGLRALFSSKINNFVR